MGLCAGQGATRRYRETERERANQSARWTLSLTLHGKRSTYACYQRSFQSIEYCVHTPTKSRWVDTYIMPVPSSLGHEHNQCLCTYTSTPLPCSMLWCCDGAFYQQTMEEVIVFCVLTSKLSTHAAFFDVLPLQFARTPAYVLRANKRTWTTYIDDDGVKRAHLVGNHRALFTNLLAFY